MPDFTSSTSMTTPSSVTVSNALVLQSINAEASSHQVKLSQTFLDDLHKLFPFDLDPFQAEAMAALQQGHSVVVCAPTGSGKTLIAEFAALHALETGKKLFYTTPLKALSNQKFYDFRDRFGEDNVGLLTGDMSVNRDARLLVMTTEIFRNMLYELGDNTSLMENVGFAVLDECHFMNDADRGTVWEESIIYAPKTIQLLPLSATVANAEMLTSWIDEIHNTTVLVESDYRPVPLRHFYFTRKKQLMPLFEQGSHKTLNHKLRTEVPLPPSKEKGKGRGGRYAYHPPAVIEALQEKDMLPAIMFTFSRKRCDEGVQQVLKDCHQPLLTRAEVQANRAMIAEHLEQYPSLQESPMLEALHQGVASHHAGLLPAMKLLVERLFQANLVKVVFATETLAAGVNMPARTTVITSLSKRSDEGHRLLKASEFLQMAGRAGRRGLDDVGYVVSIGGQDTGAPDAAKIASSPPDPLHSRFTSTYGMVLNILQRHNLERAEGLVRQCFGQFQKKLDSEPLKADIFKQQEYLTSLQHFACPAELTQTQFEHYLALKDTTHRLTKSIHHAQKQGASAMDIADMEAEKELQLSEQKASPCFECPKFGEHRGLGEKLERQHKKLRKLENTYRRQLNFYWHRFLNNFNMLKSIGYLDDENKPTGRGLLAASIRSENEVLMAEVLSTPWMADVAPETMAALIAALVNEMNRNRGGGQEAIQWSQEVRRLYRQLQTMTQRVYDVQQQFEIDAPVSLNPLGIGIVEAWAKGWHWEAVLNLTDLDPGDLVRMIRRTADILRQVSKMTPDIFPDGEGGTLISEALVENARIAYSLINREPIKEVDPLSPA
ncbi:MAG: DEAD/DEAH box helicase [Vampirovibrionales bacterium]